MMNRVELRDELMEQVAGGTITFNALAESRYNECGIRTEYHWIDKDEFWLPDGTKTDEAGANAYVKQLVGEEQYDTWHQEHTNFGNGSEL